MKSKFISIPLVLILLLITSLNISAYQATTPLLNSLTNNNNLNDALTFIKKLEFTPFYNDQLTYFTNLYGSPFSNLYSEERDMFKNKKQKLENILSRSPKSPTLLFSLAQLSLKSGLKKEAENYYAKAKEFDPAVTLPALELLK